MSLKEVLENNFPKLKLLMIYLKQIANICNKLNLIIPWGTPSGLLVNQSYSASKEIKLKPFSFKNTSIRLHKKSDGLNFGKQSRALMPNLIHSLDAASLALLVNYYFNDEKIKSNNFYSIHDCFAVTANNVELLINYIKTVYMQIYSQNEYLREFDKHMKNHIKLHYPERFNEKTLKVKIGKRTEVNFPNINIVLGTERPPLEYILSSSHILI